MSQGGRITINNSYSFLCNGFTVTSIFSMRNLLLALPTAIPLDDDGVVRLSWLGSPHHTRRSSLKIVGAIIIWIEGMRHCPAVMVHFPVNWRVHLNKVFISAIHLLWRIFAIFIEALLFAFLKNLCQYCRWYVAFCLVMLIRLTFSSILFIQWVYHCCWWKGGNRNSN